MVSGSFRKFARLALILATALATERRLKAVLEIDDPSIPRGG